MKIPRRGIHAFVIVICLAAFTARADQLRQARVTEVVKDVKLLPTGSAARPAVISDEVHNGTAVRTGLESRAELTFADATLARLGANTVFSFTEGTRNLDLNDGAMLLRVPKNAGGAKINTAAVTAAITGTTIMLEFHKHSYVKFIVLEGTGRVYLPGRIGESVLVNAGQMLITKPDAKNLPQPVDVDVKKLMKTSRLIKGHSKMGSETLIAQVAANQEQQRANGELLDTNLAIYGAGTGVILSDPTHIQIMPEATPPPIPSEFGPPSTITSPNPYGLGPGNLVHGNRPTISAGPVTDYGTTYRGPAQDGPRSLWLFGTTRPFDNVISFDSSSGQSLFNLNNAAAFKFQDLTIVGPPAIDANGATSLILVGVDGISSGAPGGTLTFPGLSTVLLATQNGSIVLGPEISFSGIPQLIFYARGDSPALTLGSPIAGVADLSLNSEGTIQVNGNVAATNFLATSNGDFLHGNGLITAPSINITGQNLNFDFRQFPDVPFGGTIVLNANGTLTLINAPTTSRNSVSATGNTITFSGIGSFDTGNELFALHGGTGGIDGTGIAFNGSRLMLQSMGDIIAGAINASTINAGGSIQTNGALISLDGSIIAGQNISTGAVAISLRASGNITAGGNIFAGGGIFGIDPTNVTAGGNIITPGLIASNVVAGGTVTVQDVTGTSVTAIVLRSLTASQVVMVNAPGFFPVYSSSPNDDGVTPDNLTLNIGSISSTGPKIPLINANGTSAFFNATSSPGSGGNVTLNILNSGLTIADGGDLSQITANGGDYNSGGRFNGGNGGNISITAAGPLIVSAPIEATSGYLRDDGVIAGNGGSVALTSSDAVTVNSRIETSSNDPAGVPVSPPRRHSARGGSIAVKSSKASGVAINISNTSQLLALLDAAAPGPGGKVTILATGANSVTNVNGTITADRGTIDIRHTGDAGQINVSGPNTTDTINAHADVIKVAALGNNGVLNVGRGTLSADTTLKLYAPGSNGTVNFVADVTLSGASTKIIAGNTVNIFNGVAVNIGGQNPASVFTNHANYTGYGGNGSLSGTFTGAGANNPQPLDQAPPLGPPPGG